MKLLLTSSGITNSLIANTVKKLAKKPIRIAFIPTVANVGSDSKEWLIKDYINCMKLGSVNIVDIAAVGKEIWLPKLRAANVIVMGGGNTAYLMKSIAKSGLIKHLPGLLKSRLYVGISAGSIVASKNIQASSEFLYGDEAKDAPKGLGYINFHVRPHLNSPKFPRVRHPRLKKIADRLDGDLYAIDDNSAVLYDNGKISVISEGKWILYKK